MNIEQLIRERLGLEAHELRGASISGEIPLTNAAINKLIADRLSTSQVPVASVRIDTHADGVVEIQLEPKARLIPSLKAVVSVDRQPVFPTDPVLHLRWSIAGMGPLAMFAAPALNLFKVLPAAVALDGDRLSVDLRELLQSRGLGDVVEHVKGLEIQTRAGVLVVRFQAGL